MSSTSRLRRFALALLGICVSGLFLWLAVRNADLDAIGDALMSAERNWAFPFLIALFAFYWLKSQRWRDLLRTSQTVSTRQLFPIIMIGYAGTAVLPMQMGELVRSYIAGKRFSIPYATVLGSIGIERMFDMLTVLVLLGTVLASGENVPEIMVVAGYTIAAACVAMAVICTLYVIHPRQSLRMSSALIFWLPATIRSKVIEQLSAAADSVAVLRSPHYILRIAASSIAQWLLMGCCVAFSLFAVNIQIPVTGIVLVLVATVIGISLPTSPGYIGNIQLAFALALKPFGIDPATAFAASVFYHILAYVAVVVVGFTYLHSYGYGIAKLHKASIESAPPKVVRR